MVRGVARELQDTRRAPESRAAVIRNGTEISDGAQRCPMRHKASVELFRYWNRLRNGRAAPKRSEVEPRAISSVLSDTFILAVGEETVFRLAGTRLCATYGRELTGLPFRSLFMEDAQRLVDRVVSGVAAEKSVAVIVFEAGSEGGRSLDFETLLLPLDNGESRQCLGVVSPRERPSWLGADPVKPATIISMRVIEPDLVPMFVKHRPAIEPAQATPRTPLLFNRPVPQVGRRAGHLVVLPGGRHN